MSSPKAKWKESFKKARSSSQTSLSLSSSRKTSIIDEETSAKELEEYLETLTRKSGIKGLWSGSSFDKAVRDEEDKTPDISISSGEHDESEQMLQSEGGMDSDDFRPNIVMFSSSLSPTSEDDSGANPMQGIQMVEFALSADETSENQLNNSSVSNRLKSLMLEEPNVRSITNDLSQHGEIGTEDEVEEEIVEEDIIESVISEAGASDGRINQASKHNSRTDPDSHSSSRNVSRTAENSRSNSNHSYTEDFSAVSDKTISERSVSHSSESRSSTSRRKSDSHHGSRWTRSSEGSYSSKSHSSWSSHSSKSKPHRENSSHRKSKTSSKHNAYTHDVGVQTNLAGDTFIPTVPPGLGIGMATSGPRLGMGYVDPSPIATHVITAEAMEAVTAYNPAIVALNDMLRQQIKLVEQFTESNRRMYEAYTRNLNSSFKYTTLEDTMEFIRKHRPKTITMEEALKRVREDDR